MIAQDGRRGIESQYNPLRMVRQGGSARDPNLDLVRAFAITAVMAAHGPKLFPLQGALGHGVDVFFVLSGFLIGRIFLRMEQGGLSLLRFWSDRWLRTLPAYYFVLLGGLVAGHVLGSPWTLRDFQGKLWEYLVFFQNYDAVSFAHPGHPFQVSWSLCVEEQFYFALPLLLLAARGRLARLMLVGGVIVASPWARHLDARDWQRTWAMTHIRFDGIGYGVLAAFLSAWWPAQVARLRPWARPVSLAWLLLFASRCFGWPARLDYLSLLNATTSLVLLCVAGAAPLPGAVSAWSRWGSALAYSLYLTHSKSYGLFDAVWRFTPVGLLPAFLKWPLIVSLTLVPALILYRLVEQPGLALRERVRRRLAGARPAPPGSAG